MKNQPSKKAEPREFWLSYNGVNFRGYTVLDKKPSGISGGGMMSSVHVIEASYAKALEKKLRVAEEFINWFGAFYRSRGYPTGTEWNLIEKMHKEALQKIEASE